MPTVPVLRVAFLATAALLTAQSPAPTPTGSMPPADITYDQVERTFINVPDGFTGRFDDDAAAVTTANASNADSPGYPVPAGSMADTLAGDPVESLKRNLAGRYRRFSFFGAESRVDDLLAHKATIADRTRMRVVYLDLANRTYRELDGPSAAALLAAPSLAAIEKRASALASAIPIAAGQATVISQTTVVTLPDRTIGTDTFPGYRYETTVSTPNATGGCPSINVRGTMTVYVDPRYPEPTVAPMTPVDLSALKNFHEGGCRLDLSIPPPPAPPLRGLQVDRLVENTMTLPLVNVTFKMLVAVERAHVSTLSPAEASSLFAIPSGFTPAPEAAGSAPAPHA